MVYSSDAKRPLRMGRLEILNRTTAGLILPMRARLCSRGYRPVWARSGARLAPAGAEEDDNVQKAMHVVPQSDARLGPGGARLSSGRVVPAGPYPTCRPEPFFFPPQLRPRV